MMNLNNVTISGRLAREPLAGGAGCVRFTVAINRKYKNNAGETKEEVCFADCEAWGHLGESTATLPVGFPVCVEGRLKLNQWEDKATGQRRSQMVVSAFQVHWMERRDQPQAQSGSARGFDDAEPGPRRPESRAAREAAADVGHLAGGDEPPF